MIYVANCLFHAPELDIKTHVFLFEKKNHVYFFLAFNKNVDIKFTMHDAFMENPYSETLKAQNIEKP
jgi:hypothetical protein